MAEHKTHHDTTMSHACTMVGQTKVELYGTPVWSKGPKNKAEFAQILCVSALIGITVPMCIAFRRWKDASGAKVCEFPSDELVRTLPEGVRKIFSRKALHHSDEYYAVREW